MRAWVRSPASILPCGWGRITDGPLESADFIGLDTCLSIMQVRTRACRTAKHRPCPPLVKYVEAGWLGQDEARFLRFTVTPPRSTRYNQGGQRARPPASAATVSGSPAVRGPAKSAARTTPHSVAPWRSQSRVFRVQPLMCPCQPKRERTMVIVGMSEPPVGNTERRL